MMHFTYSKIQNFALKSLEFQKETMLPLRKLQYKGHALNPNVPIKLLLECQHVSITLKMHLTPLKNSSFCTKPT